MMKRNGQALVEFIIVLPILIIILLGIVDFGVIFYQKNSLEGTLEEVSEIWEDNKSVDEVNKYLDNVDEEIKFSVTEKQDTTILELNYNYNVLTPGLNNMLKSPYEIKVNRVIYNG